jgi:hypothetical protein
MGPLRDNQTRIRAQHQEHLDWFKGLIDTNQVSLNVIKEYDNRPREVDDLGADLDEEE